ncbi:MAG: class I SAM-dependent methyltransferase [Cyanobacteria bacterium P01_D01_bin.6]
MAQGNIYDFDQNKSLLVSDYDVMARQLVPGYEAIFDMILAWLKRRLPDPSSLLIVGAGGGTELSVFGREKRWKMTGVDPSAEMLNTAKSKLGALALSDQVQLFQGTVDSLSNTISYDAATAVLVMHFLPDDESKLAFLKAIRQRLKDEAPLFIVTFCGERKTESFNQMLSAWKAHGIQAGADQTFVEKQVEKLLLNLPFISENRTLELLQEAGFPKVIQFYKALTYSGWTAFKS